MRNLSADLDEAALLREVFTDGDVDVLRCVLHRHADSGAPLGSAELALPSLRAAELLVTRHQGRVVHGRPLRLALCAQAALKPLNNNARSTAAGSAGVGSVFAHFSPPPSAAAHVPVPVPAPAAAAAAGPAPESAAVAAASEAALAAERAAAAEAATVLSTGSDPVYLHAQAFLSPEYLDVANAAYSSQYLTHPLARTLLPAPPRVAFEPSCGQTWHQFALLAIARSDRSRALARPPLPQQLQGLPPPAPLPLGCVSPFAHPWASFDGVDLRRNAACLRAGAAGPVRGGVHIEAVIDGADGLSSQQMVDHLRNAAADEGIPRYERDMTQRLDFDAALAAVEAGGRKLAQRWSWLDVELQPADTSATEFALEWEPEGRERLRRVLAEDARRDRERWRWEQEERERRERSGRESDRDHNRDFDRGFDRDRGRDFDRDRARSNGSGGGGGGGGGGQGRDFDRGRDRTPPRSGNGHAQGNRGFDRNRGPGGDRGRDRERGQSRDREGTGNRGHNNGSNRQGSGVQGQSAHIPNAA